MKRKPLFLDTDEGTERALLELARGMPAWRKLQIVESLTTMARELAMLGLRGRYPDASERELRVRLAGLIFDRNTAERLYGWWPTGENTDGSGSDRDSAEGHSHTK